jgi:hypothetical protein
MLLDEMLLDEMSLDKMSWRRFLTIIWKRLLVCWRLTV